MASARPPLRRWGRFLLRPNPFVVVPKHAVVFEQPNVISSTSEGGSGNFCEAVELNLGATFSSLKMDDEFR
jgi:hypothetical protein